MGGDCRAQTSSLRGVLAAFCEASKATDAKGVGPKTGGILRGCLIQKVRAADVIKNLCQDLAGFNLAVFARALK